MIEDVKEDGGGRGEASGLYTMDLKWDIVLLLS